MITKTYFQTMKDGIQVNVNRWIPDDDAKGVIVISHGMAEHSLRYDRSASFFVDAGYIVNAHDHRGHGKTALTQMKNGEPGFGYLADHHGYEKTISDLDEMIDSVKKDFPGKKVFILSHSWGSMIAQAYIEQHGEKIDGCILMGTRGKEKIKVFLGRLITDFWYLRGHKKTYSKFLDSQAFGSFSKKLPKGSDKYDWFSKNKTNIEIYKADLWCGTKMTIEFYREMFRLLKQAHHRKSIKKIRKDLPILFLTGTEDPVGNYTKNVKPLVSAYQKTGIKDVTAKYYIGYRHELLNEIDSEIVHQDIIDWISKYI